MIYHTSWKFHEFYIILANKFPVNGEFLILRNQVITYSEILQLHHIMQCYSKFWDCFGWKLLSQVDPFIIIQFVQVQQEYLINLGL